MSTLWLSRFFDVCLLFPCCSILKSHITPYYSTPYHTIPNGYCQVCCALGLSVCIYLSHITPYYIPHYSILLHAIPYNHLWLLSSMQRSGVFGEYSPKYIYKIRNEKTSTTLQITSSYVSHYSIVHLVAIWGLRCVEKKKTRLPSESPPFDVSHYSIVNFVALLGFRRVFSKIISIFLHILPHITRFISHITPSNHV